MNRRDQKWLVMLYTMNEMAGGGGQRKDVLAHINSHGYWKKNDSNDVIRPSRADRHEYVWRNDFSYERRHLVDAGYMQPGGKGVWKITDSGRRHLPALISQAKEQAADTDAGYTVSFFEKLWDEQELIDDFEQDQQLNRQLSAGEIPEPKTLPDLTDDPMLTAAPAARSGGCHAYPRDPAVSLAARKRAQYLCQIDPAHKSFLRRDGQAMYVETHHLIPMSTTDYYHVNLDREQNIVCLCSTCHNQIHCGRKEDVKPMLEKLFLSRQQSICAILGQDISLDELFRIYKVL